MGAIGNQSIEFERKPYIYEGANVVGKKEKIGPLGSYFDEVLLDDMCGCDSWEEAESELINRVFKRLLGKAGVSKEEIRYVFSGDLLGQLMATSFGLKEFERPMFGLYGACSTFGEAIGLGSMCVASGYASKVISIASSHYASATKQFRFPLSYGNQRPLSATFTVTGAGGVIISNKRGNINVRISGITTGKIVDYGVKDALNMGACMAPAAADTIRANFMDFGVEAKHYDKIITGDLGKVGQTILKKLMLDYGYDLEDRHMDCGIEIYCDEKQDTHSGGSGCGCSAVTFTSMILRKLSLGEWNRVLFVPTGALLSPVSYNEGMSVPGIAHGVVIERE